MARDQGSSVQRKGNTLHVYNNVNGFQKLCAKNPDVRKKEAAVNDSDKIFGY